MTRDAARAVTVVIPVWDAYCAYVGECVASARREDGLDVRIVVVDNASVEPLPELPAGVKVVRCTTRLEVGAARNLGLELVDTPYVMFLDADDVVLPGTLSFLLARLEARRARVTAGGRFVSWNPETGERRVVRRAPKPIAMVVSRSRRLFALANLLYNTFPVVGCVHRVEAVRAAGGFGAGSVGEDWILGALLAFRGRIDFCERPTFLRRVHRGSLWYRPHTPDSLLARSAHLRERALADEAVPRWARALIPLIAYVHRRAVRQATRHGMVEPESALLFADGRR